MPLPNLVCFLQRKNLPYRTFSHTLRSQAKKKKNEVGEVCFWRAEEKERRQREGEMVCEGGGVERGVAGGDCGNGADRR